MDSIKCDLCNYTGKSDNSHKNCKFNFFDILKKCFKKEIVSYEIQIKEKDELIKKINKTIDKLISENDSIKAENGLLTDMVSKLKNELRTMKTTFLQPSTPPLTQNESLNNAMYQYSDTSMENIEKVFDTTYISKDKLPMNHGCQSKNDSCESSPEEKKSRMQVPKRKKIPFSLKNDDDKMLNESEYKKTTWDSKFQIKTKREKSNKMCSGVSFIQPNEKTSNQKLKENQYFDNINKISPKLKLSLDRSKSIKLKQTKIKFEKNTEAMENSILKNCEMDDETFCEDLVPPTPNNSAYVVRIRSSTKLNNEEEIAIHNNLIADTTESNKNDSESSIFCLPDDTDDVICISDTPNFKLSEYDTEESRDMLEEYLDQRPDKQNLNIKKIDKNLSILEKTSPIRKKIDKAAQPGFECTECEQYYKLAANSMTGAQLQSKLNECSKHRKNMYLHNTPDGFWNPCLTPTQNKLNQTIETKLFDNKQIK